MFEKLREHARKMEEDVTSLEKYLDLKLKPIFSVTRYDPSETSVKYFEDLTAELEAANNNVIDMIDKMKDINDALEHEYNNNTDTLKVMIDDLASIESHLENYGYVKDASILNVNGNNKTNESGYNESLPYTNGNL